MLQQDVVQWKKTRPGVVFNPAGPLNPIPGAVVRPVRERLPLPLPGVRGEE